jgi:polyferredoxin
MKLSLHSPYVRLATQSLFFVAAIFLFLGIERTAGIMFPSPLLASDPLIAGSVLLFGRAFPVLFLVAAAVLLIASLVLGRAFCGWICPVGLLTDITGRFSLRIKWLDRRFGYIQYGLLAIVLLSVIVVPYLLWLVDPVIVFQRSLFLIFTLSGIPIILLLFVASSIASPRLWCRICPLGGALGVVSSISPLRRVPNGDCTDCAMCRKACPMSAISNDGKWDSRSCIRCLDCERVCRIGAVGFSLSTPSIEFSGSRRSILASGVFVGSLVLAKGIAPAVSAESPLIRPPGSLIEVKFDAACTRCESCAKACTGHVIKPAPLSAGLESVFTPMLDFKSGNCERCGTCGTVCPSGAIVKIPDNEIKIGTSAIDQDKCMSWSLGTTCIVCTNGCPKKAIVGEDVLQPRVNGSLCIGCGTCEHNCPASETAVHVSNAGERRRDD